MKGSLAVVVAALLASAVSAQTTPAGSSSSGGAPEPTPPTPSRSVVPGRADQAVAAAAVRGTAPATATGITPAQPGSDTCGATALASLIGQSRSEIPIPIDLSRRRVLCTTCPRTMDYRADRLTIFYEMRTGRVTTLQCG